MDEIDVFFGEVMEKSVVALPREQAAHVIDYYVSVAVGWVCRSVGVLGIGAMEAQYPQLLDAEARLEVAALTGDVEQTKAAGSAWMRAWRDALTAEKPQRKGDH